MTLFAAWSEIVADWAPSFPQPRTFRRATRQALGSLICVGRRALPYYPGRLVGVAVDDTRLRKTGLAIPQARYHRDPLSPSFHVNLMRGLRFLQASLLLSLAADQIILW